MSRSNLTLADMAREMRQRASFPDLTETTRDLLTTWAEALERMNADMTTEYERLCRDYDMAMEALKQNEQVLKRLADEVDRLRGRIAALKAENTHLTELQEATLFAAAASAKELRAENAALWPLVEALAGRSNLRGDWGGRWYCEFCYVYDSHDMTFPHATTCPVSQARALMAQR